MEFFWGSSLGEKITYVVILVVVIYVVMNAFKQGGSGKGGPGN